MDYSKIFDFKINHRNWEEAAAVLYSLLISVVPKELIVLTGPSRGGKTRLIEYVCRLLFPDKSLIPKGSLPYVYVEAVNSGPNGTFSTKSFMARLLEAVVHPFYALNAADSQEILYFKSMRVDRTPEHVFRAAVVRAFKILGVKYLFIDEAQHVLYAPSNAASSILDSWKCLASELNVVLIIIGAYPLLRMFHCAPHMLGRKHQVHLSRYLSNSQDILEFRRIIQTYNQKLVQHGFTGNLDEHYELLHDRSLGCIGLLRAWLMRSQVIAGIRDREINRKILLQTMHPDLELAEISREIFEGERLLKTRYSDELEVTPKKVIKDTREKSKPFQRKPKRFSPGGRNE